MQNRSRPTAPRIPGNDTASPRTGAGSVSRLASRLSASFATRTRAPSRAPRRAGRVLGAATLAWAGLSLAVLAHGAWLGGGGIDLTAASKQTISDNIQARAPALGNGDVIEVIADFPVITDGTLDGPGGYATIYVPDGFEVVGAYITDVNGSPVAARPARASTGSGVSRGWGPKGQLIFDTTANGWNPSSNDQCSLAGYTPADCNAGLAYVYGDTGIFYSTRADTAMFANGSDTATLENGYLVDPSNGTPWTTVGGTGTARVHNKWDAVHINAFGAGSIQPNGFATNEETALNGGRGTTPFRAGSPVAGPNSGADWDRYGVTGPWNRISYDGSCRADDPAVVGPEGPATGAGSVFPETTDPGVNSVDVCTVTAEGFDLNSSDLTSLPTGTNALRFAFGGIAENEIFYAVVRLRVTDLDSVAPINAEGHGGDSAEGASAGNDNPWRYWVAGSSALAPPSAEDLRVSISIVQVNGAPYTGGTIPQGATLRYRVTYGNSSMQALSNVAITVDLPTQTTGTANFAPSRGEDLSPATAPTGGTFAFQTLPTLAGLASGSMEFDVTTNAVSGDVVTATTDANSTESGPAFDSVTTNVDEAPVDALPSCSGTRFSLVDWSTDAPLGVGTSNVVTHAGVQSTITVSDNSQPFRPATFTTAAPLYASGYGGGSVAQAGYVDITTEFDSPMNGISFYVTSLDLDESVTVWGERGTERVSPAMADGPISAAMRRVALPDGSVLGERNNAFSTSALEENFAVQVGFSLPIDRVVIRLSTRQFNSASFADSAQITDIQTCADFTDAPSALGDAFHGVLESQGLYLGTTVTGDAGPGNSADASSDTDEGVEIPVLTQGLAATVVATVSGSGYLQGWIDYDGDGVFAVGTAEEIALDLRDDGTGSDLAAEDGKIEVDLVVPGDAVLSQTFARFRWSTETTIAPAQNAVDGEVEDYAVNIAAAPLVDRGDAPASYGDPTHVIADGGVAGTYLGPVSPDPEAAPQHSADATGDDLDGNDDEDGVILPTLYIGARGEITVLVNEVTGGLGPVAYLQSWIDFDGDGSFDAADMITADLQDGSAGDKDGTVNGQIVFDVDVPATATALPTFARFRWSTTAGVVAMAVDGEIEDYQLTFSNDPPPLVCDGTLYQIGGKKSALQRLTFSDSGSAYSLGLTFSPEFNNKVEAGWGFNELDGYIYGVQSNNRQLFRVDGAGGFTLLGAVPNSAAQGDVAGDILPNGIMVYPNGDSAFQLIDLADPANPSDAGQLTLSQPVTPFDMAYNPVDGRIYGIDDSTRRLFSADANNGVAGASTVTFIGPAIHDGAYESAWFDEDGRLYLWDNGDDGLYLVNTQTGLKQLLVTSADASGNDNDGTSCRGPAPLALAGIAGNVFTDTNASDIKDGAETNLGGGIAIDVYDDEGTPNDPSDDLLVASTETLSDGTYAFDGLAAHASYRIQLDEADADLPASATIGTSNPLVGVAATQNGFTPDQDFGFDPQGSDLEITKIAYQAGTTTPVTQVAEGDVIDWVVSVSNSGPGSPSNVRVIEQLPDGFAYISDSAPATGDFYDRSTGLWFVDEILSGQTETLTIRARALGSGTYTNEAEIVASSLPDFDSDFNAGFLVDDLGDGIADDDEARYVLNAAVSARTISGQLFVDTGVGGGTAHDALRNGDEVGGAQGVLSILDDAGTLLARPELDGAGNWSYGLAGDYAGTITLSVAPDEGWLTVSEASASHPGVTNADPHDGSFTFTPTAETDHPGLDFGLAPKPELTQDQTMSVEPGQVIGLPHLYKAGSAGEVSFSFTNLVQKPDASYSVGLFTDADCDGAPESAITAPVAVTAGQELCLVSRVSVGGGVGPGASFTYDLVADTSYSDTTVTYSSLNSDRVETGDGRGQLSLRKYVRNETQGTPEGTSNEGAVGDILEYRIELSNPSSSSATDVVIYDRTPSYTALAEPIPSPVTLDGTLSCTVGAPTSNVAGYSGSLRWDCSGSYPPGSVGSVSFRVQISP
ncbi:putative repeat protein (TIGR01451 family) [Brevirhabdus pacifica]|uniref:DUF11 domain-containing protein n=1 Tax=Brevirhabdus pacifica TaxID=1267768 RepID=UPI000C1C2B88|nr:DUF11 domain-containing protein [Brevirhabdus pacifica]PJJ86647.1 putative repeat protein (TIGR01451 family) [Brevirhabdus pacifica]